MFDNARVTYLANAVSTASPARLLLMLCDRLTLDLQRALAAQRKGDYVCAHHDLLHAQEIVMELRSTLRVDAWDGATGLAALYDWLFTSMVRANISRDEAVTANCLDAVAQLSEAWRQAALVAQQAS